MNFLFGKKKPVSPLPSKAIDKLRETLEILEKRENFLEKQILTLKEQSIKYLNEKNKAKALYFLKKSKLLEKEVESIVGQKLNLETQISALTQAITNSETIQAMKIGRDTLTVLESKFDTNKVSDVMDDLSDNLSKVGEITEVMSRPIGSIVDDDDLLQELTSMSIQDNILSEPNLSDMNHIKKTNSLILPDVPAKKNDLEDEELRKLETIMNA